MHPVIAKTFGGLSGQYYVRQFLFGLIFPALILFALSHGTTPHPVAFSTYAGVRGAMEQGSQLSRYQ
ncbi:hypothetical protein Xkhy_14485 [Xanthomonas axonopodis pv. khayae]|uniref:hypothetical protein n=1 Tax=Xanthomonas axonopodis TaxID=53413 RepID=UPI000998ADC3|nr:hypothetical protein [Xanthomonas axonopodis]OOX14317.1 hypothetical protein Xkhy_14485 [Xanthomonas axonopodis pv. khayae]